MRRSALLLCFMCASCAASAQAPPPVAPALALAKLRTLIGTAPCSDDGQCRTVGVGVRPCGGPEAYLAWSSAHSPPADVAALAERYRRERQVEVERSGAISDCKMMLDPGAECRAQRCVLRSAGGVVDPR